MLFHNGESLVCPLFKKRSEPIFIDGILIDELFQHELLSITDVQVNFLHLEPYYLLKLCPKIFTPEAAQEIEKGCRYNLDYLQRMNKERVNASVLVTHQKIQLKITWGNDQAETFIFDNIKDLENYLTNDLPILLLQKDDMNALTPSQLIIQAFPHAYEYYETILKWSGYILASLSQENFHQWHNYTHDCFGLGASVKLDITYVTS